MNGAVQGPKVQGVSIVVLGSFNPTIYHPLWFSANNLIRSEERENAKIDVVHKDVTAFATEWFALQVLQERFSVESTDPAKWLPLCDLVKGTFKILEHTPVSALGFNADLHFEMATEKEWHALGDRYAPKTSWQSFLEKPGLLSLTMQGKRPDCDAKYIHVRIGPSLNKTVQNGVNININQHYEISQGEDALPPIELLLRTLGDPWIEFLAYGKSVWNHLLQPKS